MGGTDLPSADRLEIVPNQSMGSKVHRRYGAQIPSLTRRNHHINRSLFGP